MLVRFTTWLEQTTTASRLLFALGWHFMPQECEFWEIFEFKNFSFEEGIIVQGLKPPRKVKAGLAPGRGFALALRNAGMSAYEQVDLLTLYRDENRKYSKIEIYFVFYPIIIIN